MRLSRRLALFLAAAMVAATGPSLQGAWAADKLAPGYLAGAAVPDTSQVVPPPPAAGSAAERWDQEVYQATRKLKDTPRWDLARADVDYGVDALAADFSCALGVRLDLASAPATLHLLARVRSDAAIGSSRAKGQYKRPRPFIGNDAPICVPRDPELIASPSYPSGHATIGWSVGMVLSELAPERATQLMTRGRAFGESRVVCGVHNASDVEAARTAASTVIAAVNGSVEFQADLAAARAEVTKLRANPDAAPYPGQCSAEGLLAKRPW